MNIKPNHIVCHNPACGREVVRGDALLRSVSLQQVAFCSEGCVDVFDQLDKATRAPKIPAQRRPKRLTKSSPPKKD